jgi:hypothetical protein
MAVALNYRRPVLAGALVLAGVGLWLSVIHLSSYMTFFNDSNYARHWVWRENEDGSFGLHFCASLGCTSYTQLQQRYFDYFMIDAIFLSASGGLFVLLFAWRSRVKAKSIV